MTAIDLTPRRELTARSDDRLGGPAGRAGRELTPRMRLTARGRALILAIALVLAGGVFAGQSAMADVPGEPVAVSPHTVVAGETLWEIASTVAAPGEDLRDVVDTLVDLNGLSGGGIEAGQRILVPVR